MEPGEDTQEPASERDDRHRDPNGQQADPNLWGTPLRLPEAVEELFGFVDPREFWLALAASISQAGSNEAARVLWEETTGLTVDGDVDMDRFDDCDPGCYVDKDGRIRHVSRCAPLQSHENRPRSGWARNGGAFCNEDGPEMI